MWTTKTTTTKPVTTGCTIKGNGYRVTVVTDDGVHLTVGTLADACRRAVIGVGFSEENVMEYMGGIDE